MSKEVVNKDEENNKFKSGYGRIKMGHTFASVSYLIDDFIRNTSLLN